MKKFILMFCGFCLVFAHAAKAPAQTITNQPQSITVNNASTASFTVGASNATSYQWQFNGANLSDTNFGYGGTISGSTNATLTLEDVMTNQEGSYTVIVSNSLATNSVTSSNAVLTLTNGTIVRVIFTNFLSGGTNYVDVQLFDHDKPATVQNFLHYINAGAYTNMFFDRCSPQFVLQGGDDGAVDRTNKNSPVTGWDIASKFTTSSHQPNPPFPPQVDSEFNVGPLIHNRFGTVAMALHPNNQNSATSAFFFNLTDNSANLDFQNGGFTVFGRILDGTNVLQYFYGLTIGDGIVTSSTFLDQGILNTEQPFPDLPVDYHGSGQAANTNLVFCDFSFVSTLPPDTNPPTALITFPAPGTVETNGNPTVQGTAFDNVGLALVTCMLNPQAAADGTIPNGGVSLTNVASGTTSWSNTFTNSVDAKGLVPPGNYNLSVVAQDGAGYLSPPASQPLTITAIVVDGGGTATLSNGVFTNLNAVGYPFQNSSNYYVTATPGTNQLFVNWSSGDEFVFNPEVSFSMSDGFVATATFISNGLPNSLAFTYPTSNAIISTNPFNITGTIGNVPAQPVTVTCQIYSTSSYLAVGPPLTNVGTSAWSVDVATNLPIDSYIVEAIAVDANGDSTVITQNFSVAASYPLQLQLVGPGTVSPDTDTNGEPLVGGTTFQITAVPNPGQFFLTWSNATGVSINPAQSNTISGVLDLTATFVSNTMPNSIAFTSPPTNAVLSNGTVRVAGTISNVPSPPVTVTCQIFSQSTLLAVSPALTTIGTNNWSITVSNLVAGSYIAEVEAVDQASNSTVITENFDATVDTNLPTVVILSPATNVMLTDNNHFTASGTASNNVPIARVTGYLIPQSAADGTYPNGGRDINQDADGTTNWSIDFGIVPPGVYSLLVGAMDDAGNLADQTEIVTNTAIVINGSGSVSLTQAGVVKSNVVGYPLRNGLACQAVATPGAGQVFLGWTEGAATTYGPWINFTMTSGLLWTVTFVPATTGQGLAFTHPTNGARLTTNSFRLTGTMSPSLQTAGINCRITSFRNGFGVGPLLAANGPGTWAVDVSNLPPGNYVVEAATTNASGPGTIALEKFTVAAFSQAVGTYTGLFICTNSPVAPDNSGFLTFTVGPMGTFSGRLAFPAHPAIPIYPTAFENIDFTTGYYTFGFGDFYGSPLSGVVYLDLSGGTGSATGTISSATWTSELICYRAVTKLSTNTTPATGKYILSLQPGNPTTNANTNGYASVVVAKDGVLSLSGVLSDNAAFSGSSRVSQEGIWPVYVIPAGYQNNGMLMGWEGFDKSGSCSGQLFWYKYPYISTPYYARGIGTQSNMVLNAAGTNCSRPATNSQYSIVFSEGTNVPLLTNILMVNDAGQFVVSNNPADLLKISLSANSVITGTVLNTTNHTPQPFKGAFISPSQGGSGFIPEPNEQIGTFLLQLEPQ